MKEIVINKKELKANIENIVSYAKKNKTRIIAVVKANGMGLDLIKYTNFLKENGIDFFAVATNIEAIKLREVGIKEEILMMTPTCIESELQELIDNNITLTIDSIEQVNICEKYLKKQNKNINAHIKIDTGFGRYRIFI